MAWPPIRLQPGHAVHHIHGQAEAVNVVVDRQFQRRIECFLFSLYPAADVGMIRAPVRQAVNQLRIAVKVEHDWLVDREQGIELAVRESVRMFARRLERNRSITLMKRILRSGNSLRRQIGSSQRFLRRDVAGGSHHQIGLAALIVAGPIPDTDALRAMNDGGFHAQILQDASACHRRSH